MAPNPQKELQMGVEVEDCIVQQGTLFNFHAPLGQRPGARCAGMCTVDRPPKVHGELVGSFCSPNLTVTCMDIDERVGEAS